MANTYEYKITDMQRDANGIVVAVSFTITASDGADSFTHNYHTALTAPADSPIPYDNLDEATVIGWVKSLVQAGTEEQADAELAAFKQRKEVTSGTPWATAEA
jgi:hypothetical protein